MAEPLALLQQFLDTREDALFTQILNLDTDTEQAVVAIYRLGLFSLENDQSLEKATELFKKAASSPVKCDDRYAAQVSYAIVLGAQDKRPTGIFQLRKVLSEVPADSMHATMALDYLSLFLHEENAPADDIAKLDALRVETLTKLVHETHDAEEKSELEIRLAVALSDRHQAGDYEHAIQILSKINSDVAKDLLKLLKNSHKK